MNAKERALLKDCAMVLASLWPCPNPHYVAALHRRIKKALAKKGKHKLTRMQAKLLQEEKLDGDGRRG